MEKQDNMKDFWSEIKHFTHYEFDSPDLRGSGVWMDEKLIQALDSIRSAWGDPIRINSGFRTVTHNEKIGGVRDSQHTKHKAADIHITDQDMGDFIEKMFDDLMDGKGGIGRYNNFIHLDSRDTKARWDNRS